MKRNVFSRLFSTVLSVLMLIQLVGVIPATEVFAVTNAAEQTSFTVSPGEDGDANFYDNSVLSADTSTLFFLSFDPAQYLSLYQAFLVNPTKVNSQRVDNYVIPFRTLFRNADSSDTDHAALAAFDQFLAELRDINTRAELYAYLTNYGFEVGGVVWEYAFQYSADVNSGSRNFNSVNFRDNNGTASATFGKETSLDISLVPRGTQYLMYNAASRSLFRARVSYTLKTTQHPGGQSFSAYSNEITINISQTSYHASTYPSCTTPGTVIYYEDALTGTKFSVYPSGVANNVTCSDGIIRRQCVPIDDDGVIDSTKPALGHDWYVVSDTATCTDGGVASFACTRCTATKTEPSDPLGHDIDDTSWAYAADGTSRWHPCSRCDLKTGEVAYNSCITVTPHGTPAYHDFSIEINTDYPRFSTSEYVALYNDWNGETDADLKAEKLSRLEGYRLFFRNVVNYYNVNFTSTYDSMIAAIEASPSTAVSGGLGISYGYYWSLSKEGDPDAPFLFDELDSPDPSNPTSTWMAHNPVYDVSILNRYSGYIEFDKSTSVTAALQMSFRISSGSSYLYKGIFCRRSYTLPAMTAGTDLTATCTEPGRRPYFIDGNRYFSIFEDGQTIHKVDCSDGKQRTQLIEITDLDDIIKDPALGHDFSVRQSSLCVAPTCTETGLEVYKCSRCDETFSTVLEALGHDVDDSVWVYAADGSSRWHPCGRCDTHYGEVFANDCLHIAPVDGASPAWHDFAVEIDDSFPRFSPQEYAALRAAYDAETDPDLKAEKLAEANAYAAFFRTMISSYFNGNMSIYDDMITVIDADPAFGSANYTVLYSYNWAINYRYLDNYDLGYDTYSGLDFFATQNVLDLSIVPMSQSFNYASLAVFTCSLGFKVSSANGQPYLSQSIALGRRTYNIPAMISYPEESATCTASAHRAYYKDGEKYYSLYSDGNTLNTVTCADSNQRAMLIEVDPDDLFFGSPLGHDADETVWVWNEFHDQRWHVCSVCGEAVDVENFIIYGDASGDDDINTLDLTIVRQYLADSSTSVKAGVDVDGSGEVNTVDLTLLRQYLADTSTHLGPTEE
ncbi:MAG: dockerin type I repeat-containing protein [Clostridia bacterium]|nr:dockerin type I repeat-containing protein [Clostridia bacterium]